MRTKAALRTILIILLMVASFLLGVGSLPLLTYILSGFWSISITLKDGTSLQIGVLLYLAIITIIPLIILLLWTFAPVRSKRDRFVSILLVVACIVLSLWLRIIFIRIDVDERMKETMEKTSGTNFLFPKFFYAENLYLWAYISVAIVIASGLTYIFLRDRKRISPEFSFETKKD